MSFEFKVTCAYQLITVEDLVKNCIYYIFDAHRGVERGHAFSPDLNTYTYVGYLDFTLYGGSFSHTIKLTLACRETILNTQFEMLRCETGDTMTNI